MLDSWFTLDFSLGLINLLVGFISSFAVDWIKRPRVKFLGFYSQPVNFGTLYKLRFRIKGCSSPGLCQLTISWSEGEKIIFAKWDETPNPLECDNPSKFRPRLVPATYDQHLFCGNEYTVPVIIEPHKGKYEVFSGWWFGKNRGYGPNPEVNKQDRIKLTLSGAGLSKTEEFSISCIICCAMN